MGRKKRKKKKKSGSTQQSNESWETLKSTDDTLGGNLGDPLDTVDEPSGPPFEPRERPPRISNSPLRGAIEPQERAPKSLDELISSMFSVSSILRAVMFCAILAGGYTLLSDNVPKDA